MIGISILRKALNSIPVVLMVCLCNLPLLASDGKPEVKISSSTKTGNESFVKVLRVSLTSNFFNEESTVHRIELGDLLVSKSHAILLKFAPVDGQKLRLAGSSTSCGCVAAEELPNTDEQNNSDLLVKLVLKGIGTEQEFSRSARIVLGLGSGESKELLNEIQFDVSAYFRSGLSFHRNRLVARLQDSISTEENTLSWVFMGNLAKEMDVGKVYVEAPDLGTDSTISIASSGDERDGNYCLSLKIPKSSFQHGKVFRFYAYGTKFKRQLICDSEIAFFDDLNIKTFPTLW